jgi:hypothetical protein
MRRDRQREGRKDGRTDGQTNRHNEAIIAFHNFANPPNYLLSLKQLCRIREEFYTLKCRLPLSHLHLSLCFTPNPLQPRVLERTVIRTWKPLIFLNLSIFQHLLFYRSSNSRSECVDHTLFAMVISAAVFYVTYELQLKISFSLEHWFVSSVCWQGCGVVRNEDGNACHTKRDGSCKTGPT